MAYPNKLGDEYQFISFRVERDVISQIDQQVREQKKTRGSTWTRADWMRQVMRAAVERGNENK